MRTLLLETALKRNSKGSLQCTRASFEGVFDKTPLEEDDRVALFLCEISVITTLERIFQSVNVIKPPAMSSFK